LYILNNMNE